MTTDAPRSDSPPDTEAETEFLSMTFAGPAHVNKLLAAGYAPHVILGHYKACYRPAIARYLVQQGEILRSEFRSEKEAEAFWAHVGEDARCDFCHCMHAPDAPGFEGCAAELEAMYQPERHR